MDDEVIDKLRNLLPALDQETLKKTAHLPWNQANQVEVEEWLVGTMDQKEKERLRQLGNTVVPRCAEVAIAVPAHV